MICVCISQHPALCLALGPGPLPRSWSPNLSFRLQSSICAYRPWHPICIYRLWPPIYIYRSWPPICIYRLWPPIFIYRPYLPIFIYRAWLPICIYRSWPTILLPVRGLSLHIPTLCPQFVVVFTVLAYDLYYRFGAWICIYLIIGSSSSGSSNSSSSNFFGTTNTNIFIPVLVN